MTDPGFNRGRESTDEVDTWRYRRAENSERSRWLGFTEQCSIEEN